MNKILVFFSCSIFLGHFEGNIFIIQKGNDQSVSVHYHTVTWICSLFKDSLKCGGRGNPSNLWCINNLIEHKLFTMKLQKRFVSCVFLEVTTNKLHPKSYYMMTNLRLFKYPFLKLFLIVKKLSIFGFSDLKWHPKYFHLTMYYLLPIFLLAFFLVF